jgi:voltage-gated potassium channel
MDPLDKKLISTVSLAIVLILIGTFFYHHFEGWRYLDSFYFSATTLTTVGFGDLHPTSDISKIFTVFYVLFGVGIILYAVTLFGSHYVEKHLPVVQSRIRERISRDILNRFRRKQGPDDYKDVKTLKMFKRWK